ncbi:hypothetical protein AB4Z19_15640 [Pseudoduganella sp. RAF19]|uniref:hypothetical protein n=1 Tax=Bacteria TaxID=2 RepID=UPI003F948F49
MAIETAGVGAGIKIFGLPVLAGSAAVALTFLFMWPNSRREAFVRFLSTILTSAILGPVLVIALHAWWPTLFTSAKEMAVMYGIDQALGMLFVSAPIMVLAGLPAWWVLGAIVLWLEKRRGKDIGEMAEDAAAVVKNVRSGL